MPPGDSEPAPPVRGAVAVSHEVSVTVTVELVWDRHPPHINQAADSGAIGPLIPVGSGPRFRWEMVQGSGGKWSSCLEVTGMVDHLPECWTTWTGTVDQITGIGQ